MQHVKGLTYGSGEHIVTGRRTHYAEGDYGAAWASAPTLPTNAKEGDEYIFRNTKAGESNASRRYLYLNGHWFYTAVTYI